MITHVEQMQCVSVLKNLGDFFPKNFNLLKILANGNKNVY